MTVVSAGKMGLLITLKIGMKEITYKKKKHLEEPLPIKVITYKKYKIISLPEGGGNHLLTPQYY